MTEDHVVIARGYGRREAASWEDLVQEAETFGIDLSGAARPR
jgi:hypothetical protein